MNHDANGVDEDGQFLDDLLDKLYDFGGGAASQKKNKSQKKQKRKRCEEEEEAEEGEDARDNNVINHTEVGRTKHVAALKQLQTETHTAPGSQTNQVPVVSFQDPRKKLKIKQPTTAPERTSTKEKTQEEQPEELSLEKARLEVHRFGITGYKKEQQRVFEQDRAVMLGARPPKKSYVNYKTLQQQIKEKKQKAKEAPQPELKKKKGKKQQQSNLRDKQRKKTKVSSGSSSGLSGQVGHFKNGMLILSSKEIQKIKGTRRRK
ncbi:40S small subunit processome assembly factor 1 [Genypterus blacodes]|uniref:40S small subunit processome assembly factor 1 n=1 Tax=Genypterus blacodes TaxID=154954 RepID=UPI003F768304